MHHLVDKIEGHTKEITMVKEFFLDDAEYLLISYGSSARTALHVVENRRERGEKIGLLELLSLWPFPVDTVRERCACVNYVIVVEMNMGQILQEVKKASDEPDKVFLANKIDGSFIAPTDVLNILRIIQGKGA
jgi:2-oxoglutarate ferredoxin oxidoreductase subunit alpha